MIHIHNYKQSANSEVHSDNDEIFIPVSTNIPKEISPTSSMLSKSPTATHTSGWHGQQTATSWFIKARNGKECIWE